MPIESTFHCGKCGTIMEMIDYQIIKWHNHKGEFCDDCQNKLKVDEKGFSKKIADTWMPPEDLDE